MKEEFLHQRLDAKFLKTKDSYIDALRNLGIHSLEDLFYHFPKRYRDEQNFTSIAEMRTDEINVVSVTVVYIKSMKTKTGKVMTRALVKDSSGEIPVIWFNQSHLERSVYPGTKLILSGKIKFDLGKISMPSPKWELASATLLHTGRLVPEYPENETISSSWLRKKIYDLLHYTEAFREKLPSSILEQEKLMPLPLAMKHIHFPKDEAHLEAATRRLAFEEMFHIHFHALQGKKAWKEAYKSKILLENRLWDDWLPKLPFELTNAQKRVLDEIKQDLLSEYPMRRLVQGDVGAGKTVIAAACIYTMFQSGKQSALMVPTEILAKQHFEKMPLFFKETGLKVALLVASMKNSEKKAVHEALRRGTVDLVIGTHALIQEHIEFSNLGLVVIDEQHRFGVKQRNAFSKHGSHHVLSLSATPIPRTLALTLYGDQDVSILDEKPKGRREIVTRIVPESKRVDSYLWIKDNIHKGRQVFVICPLIEESDKSELKAALQTYEHLKEHVFSEFGMGLLHGKLSAAEKEAVMQSFSENKISILVSTSVVEVGIDVPNASIMLIEEADRFGLAQLHQFRGRVGRGEHQSYCFLMSQNQSEIALKRLQAMVKHDSGFTLAELDLELRGPGEVYGVKQSGLPDLKMANLNDYDLIQSVRTHVEQLLEEDPFLEKYPELKLLLHKKRPESLPNN